MSLTFSDICNDIKTFLESICRTCSRIENGEEDLQFKRIFAIAEPESTLNEKPINYIASDDLKDVFDEILLWKLNIKPDDGLPQQICHECLERFNGVKNFRSICMDTQTLLKSYVNHVDTLLESGSLGRLSPKSGSLKSELCNSPAPLLNADDLIEESPETPERQISQHDSPQLSPKYHPTHLSPQHNAEAVYAESSMGTPPPLFDEMRTEPIDMETLEYLKAESDIEIQKTNKGDMCGETADILHPLNFVSSSSGSEGEDSDDEPFTDSEMDTVSYNMNLLRRKTQENGFICKICSKSFKTKYQLSQHKYRHNRLDSLKCEVCGKHFRSQLHLQRHHKNFHLTSTYTCHICNEKFENFTQMRFQYHIRQHGEKRFQCQYCEKSFHQKIHLTNHERTHTKEQPFHCDICGKCYRQQTACREHMLTHQDPTPFKCTICSKGFTQRSSLRTHLRGHSKHNNKNNNQQIFNGESSAQHFNKESSFGRHQFHHKLNKLEINSQLLNINAQGFAHKVLNCKFCDKSFQKQQLLLLHIQQSHGVSIEHEGDLSNWLPFHTQINNRLSPSRKDAGTDKEDLQSLFNI